MKKNVNFPLLKNLTLPFRMEVESWPVRRGQRWVSWQPQEEEKGVTLELTGVLIEKSKCFAPFPRLQCM